MNAAVNALYADYLKHTDGDKTAAAKFTRRCRSDGKWQPGPAARGRLDRGRSREAS